MPKLQFPLEREIPGTPYSARTDKTSEYSSDRENEDVDSLPETSQQAKIMKEIEEQVRFYEKIFASLLLIDKGKKRKKKHTKIP